MDRFRYFDAISPFCNRDRVAVMYERGEGIEPRIDWVEGANAEIVLQAWQQDDCFQQLESLELEPALRKGGKEPTFKVSNIKLVGMIPVINEEVHLLTLDIDRKPDSGLPPVTLEDVNYWRDWLGVDELIAFWSKGGTGAHAIAWLKEPLSASDYINLGISWGFAGVLPVDKDNPQHTKAHINLINVEWFPTNVKSSQLWLPGDPDNYGIKEGEPHPHGFITGSSVEAAKMKNTLDPLPFNAKCLARDHIEESAMVFLMGRQRSQGSRNSALNKVTHHLMMRGMTAKACARTMFRACNASGLAVDEESSCRKTVNSGITSAIGEIKDLGFEAGSTEYLKEVTDGKAGSKGKKTQKEAQNLLALEVAEKLIEKGSFARVDYKPSGLYTYIGGVYRSDGQSLIRQKLQATLKSMSRYLTDFTPQLRDNILQHVIDSPATVKLLEKRGDHRILNCEDCLLDFREDPDNPVVTDHTPKHITTVQSPIRWKHPEPDPSIWEKFIRDMVAHGEDEKDNDKRVRLMYEVIGDCLMPSQEARRARQQAILLIGPAEQGKSTLIGAIVSLVGQENVSTFSPEQLEGDNARFTLSQLFGKALCANADIGYQNIKTATNFKQICSGDTIFTDVKNAAGINFAPICRMIFGSNRWPNYASPDKALYRRWIPITVRLDVPIDDRDPRMIDKLNSPEARSGLLHTLVERKIFSHLLSLQKYRIPASINRELKHQIGEETPMITFFESWCYNSQGKDTPIEIFVIKYNEWRVDQGLPVETGKAIGGDIKRHLEVYGVRRIRRNEGGVKIGFYTNITVKDREAGLLDEIWNDDEE